MGGGIGLTPLAACTYSHAARAACPPRHAHFDARKLCNLASSDEQRQRGDLGLCQTYDASRNYGRIP